MRDAKNRDWLKRSEAETCLSLCFSREPACALPTARLLTFSSKRIGSPQIANAALSLAAKR